MAQGHSRDRWGPVSLGCLIPDTQMLSSNLERADEDGGEVGEQWDPGGLAAPRRDSSPVIQDGPPLHQSPPCKKEERFSDSIRAERCKHSPRQCPRVFSQDCDQPRWRPRPRPRGRLPRPAWRRRCYQRCGGSRKDPNPKDAAEGRPAGLRTRGCSRERRACQESAERPGAARLRGAKLYAGQLSGKAYSHRGTSTLKRHLRTHCPEKGFLCAQCSRGFRVASELAQHTRVHSGERPYRVQTAARPSPTRVTSEDTAPGTAPADRTIPSPSPE